MIDREIISALTNLGDAGFVGMIALSLAVYLAFVDCRRQALVLIGAFVAAAFLIGAAKFAVLETGSFFTDWNIHSPSGHVAISTATYGTLALILSARLGGWRRDLVWTATGLVLGLIAASRLLLHAHSGAEIVAGFIIGLVTLLPAFLLLRGAKQGSFDTRIIIAILLVILIFFHGRHIYAEKWIGNLAAASEDWFNRR